MQEKSCLESGKIKLGRREEGMVICNFKRLDLYSNYRRCHLFLHESLSFILPKSTIQSDAEQTSKRMEIICIFHFTIISTNKKETKMFLKSTKKGLKRYLIASWIFFRRLFPPKRKKLMMMKKNNEI